MKTYKEKSIKVNFKEQDYWFLQEKDGSGQVALLSHCDKNGELSFPSCFIGDSFAHVGKDRIVRRYGERLGKIDKIILGNIKYITQKQIKRPRRN